MKYDQLINKQYHILQRNKINKDKDKFIYNEICSRINLSIDVINLSINNCLEIGFHSKKIEEYICSKYPHVNFYLSDLLKYLHYMDNSNNYYDRKSTFEKKITSKI